ncbi:transcriptional regulator [Virgibacillus phasianinus]|uniref:Transcriptional regulator n=1 Tax=Virgibacillus phasianinus TaxID=2017483 RepID=A0A220U6K3_9BACI|nr:helix-turn-helix transcriptional regulator [Virgibacillus phasianinus]ASK63720.1 transcriptional regulator [Virgibacillus phasianinus]
MIGKNIQVIRKKKGLTLSELASRASISKSYLSNIERNVNTNPSVQIMEKIAAVLDVDLQVLVDSTSDSQAIQESEWIDFVKELKDSGVDKEQLQEFKTLIEFAKWKNENGDVEK